MRLIDADALKFRDVKAQTNEIDPFGFGGYYVAECKGILQEEIWNAPTIDAVPVRHGKWELYSDGCSKYVNGCSKECTGCRDNNDCLVMNKRCSICKRPTPWIVSECSVCGGVGADAHGGHLEYTFKQYEPMYCPNCGAKMDEEKDDDKNEGNYE